MDIFHPSYRVPWDTLEGEEMPKATLSYEALQLEEETGNVLEGAYKLKLEGNFNTHVEPIVKMIKQLIPSSERTYEPTTREWFYHEKYHNTIKQLLDGLCYQIVFTIRKEDFVELKCKQTEWARQAEQQFKTQTYDTTQDILNYQDLLIRAGLVCDKTNTSIIAPMPIKDWNRENAEKAYKKAIRFFHPDLHPERAVQASQLNEIWSRLKEGYYIK